MSRSSNEERPGASLYTLVKRSKYKGSRKARRAVIRLFLQHSTSVSWAYPPRRIQSRHRYFKAQMRQALLRAKRKMHEYPRD